MGPADGIGRLSGIRVSGSFTSSTRERCEGPRPKRRLEWISAISPIGRSYS